VERLEVPVGLLERLGAGSGQADVDDLEDAAGARGEHDHPAVVWDELAAFPITLFALPSSWPYLLVAVILFRFFDIAKPGVIGHIDRHWHGGVGVMLDDIIAAVLTWVILATAHVVILFSSQFIQ